VKNALPIVGNFRHSGSCFQLFAEDPSKARPRSFLDVRKPPRQPYLIITADPISGTLTINYNDAVTVLPARWEDGCTFMIHDLTFGVLLGNQYTPMMRINNNAIALQAWIDELNRRISECRRVKLPRAHQL